MNENQIPAPIAHAVATAKNNGLLTDPSKMVVVMAVRPGAIAKRLMQKFAPGTRDNVMVAVLYRADVAKVLVQGSPNAADAVRNKAVPEGHILTVVVANDRSTVLSFPIEDAEDVDPPEGGTVHRLSFAREATAEDGERRVNEIMVTCAESLDPLVMSAREDQAILVLDPADHDARVYWIEPLSQTFPQLRQTPPPGGVAAIVINRSVLTRMREAEGHSDALALRNVPKGHRALFFVAGGCAVVIHRRAA